MHAIFDQKMIEALKFMYLGFLLGGGGKRACLFENNIALHSNWIKKDGASFDHQSKIYKKEN